MLNPSSLYTDFFRFENEFGHTLQAEGQAFCLLPERAGVNTARWFIGPRDDILDWLDPDDIPFQLIAAHAIVVYKGCTSESFVKMAIKLWRALLDEGYTEISFRTSRQEYEAAFLRGAQETGRSIFTPLPFMEPIETPPTSPILLAMRYGGYDTDTLHTEKYAALSWEDFDKEWRRQAHFDAHLVKFALDKHESQSPLLANAKTI